MADNTSLKGDQLYGGHLNNKKRTVCQTGTSTIMRSYTYVLHQFVILVSQELGTQEMNDVI